MYVRDLSKEMVRRGHSVTIAFVSSASACGRSLDFESDFKRSLSDYGIAQFELGHSCRTYPWLGGWRLRRLVREWQADIIHSHLYYGLIFKLFSRLEIRTIYTHHSMRLRKGKWLYPLFNSIVDSYIGISKDCASELTKAGARNVTVIYNGVDRNRITSSTGGRTGKKFRLVAVGRLVEEKNYSLLLQAIRQILSQRTELRGSLELNLIGEGPLRPILKSLIARLGLQGIVNLVGNTNHVAFYLRQSDLFVLSSDNEGLPISLLEALTAGLPVVATDVGSCRDVLDHCQAGLVVPRKDSAALATAIQIMIDNRLLYESLADNARKHSADFSIEAACDRHLELYHSLICNAD